MLRLVVNRFGNKDTGGVVAQPPVPEPKGTCPILPDAGPSDDECSAEGSSSRSNLVRLFAGRRVRPVLGRPGG